MTGKENPHGGQAERVKKVMRLINTTLDDRVTVRVSYSRGEMIPSKTGSRRLIVNK